jgi:hypothetical protein
MNDNALISTLIRWFTPEGLDGTPITGFGDHYIFLIGRDDCHGIMKYLLERETLEHDENMYGYDDQELNDLIMAQIKNPNMRVQLTLDRSQAGGVHEKVILAADEVQDPTGFANSVAIGQSATHQISHTKGGVLVGLGVAYEGSMNWSSAGEGQGISLVPGVNSTKGFKAQNNTLVISANPVFVSRFRTRLAIEHETAKAQEVKRASAPAK